jgi:hypothetical protein
MAVALNDGTYRSTITRMLGDGEFVQVNVDAFWAIQAARTSNLYLVYLRTLDALISGELGNLGKQNLSLEGDDPRGTGARSQRDARRVELLAIRQNITDNLTRAEDAGTGLLPAAGVMSAVSPTASPSGYPDANAIGYSGSPDPAYTTHRIMP